MKHYASAGAQDLPPLIEKAADALGIAGKTEKVETLGEALATAYMAGINRDEAEIMAQAAEQRFNTTVDQQRAPYAACRRSCRASAAHSSFRSLERTPRSSRVGRSLGRSASVLGAAAGRDRGRVPSGSGGVGRSAR
jgi:hypothetical protein